MRRRPDLHLVAGAVGALVLAFLLYRLGWSEVLAELRRVGWGWLLILGQEILPILANTLGWHYAFLQEERRVPFGRLLRLRLAGDGFNYLIPSATVGGELLRIHLLRREMALAASAASVTVAKFTQMLGQALFIGLGLMIAAPGAPLREGLLPVLWALLAGCLLFLGVVLGGLRWGLFSRLTGLLLRWLPARVRGLLPVDQAAALDREIAGFLTQDQASFWLSVLLFGLAWGLGTVEVLLICHFLGVPVTLATAVTIETLSVFVDGVLFFVPGKLGTQEGGKVLIFLSLGLSPVSGLAFGLIRRLRELTWAGLGVACLLTFREESPRSAPET
ncbi:MAG: lysylphosphatidylglycerol synthase domain-containing protein [Syntrophobacterales bacterium]|nr:lysylphosphatidylglycerol synthase domain-containing protein [Syntrophobacterales bacterium]